MRDPAGPNPNYVGPPGNHHGMSTGGSNYKLKYAVPMCYVSDDNTDKKGLRLEMINIPHHAFSDPLKIGKAVVTVSSGETFRQSNQFQLYAPTTLFITGCDACACGLRSSPAPAAPWADPAPEPEPEPRALVYGLGGTRTRCISA